MDTAMYSTICSMSCVVRYAPYRLTLAWSVLQSAQTVPLSAVMRNSYPFCVV